MHTYPEPHPYLPMRLQLGGGGRDDGSPRRSGGRAVEGHSRQPMHTYPEPHPYLPSATNGVFTAALLAQLDVTTPTHVVTLFIRVTGAVEDATDKMRVPHSLREHVCLI